MATKRTKRATPRILNCEPSRNRDDDWRLGHATAAGFFGPPRRRRIPAEKDLRESWWRIGDQGSTGSCVGWATADSVLRWHFVNAGRLGEREELSVRFVWMASKETDEFDSRPTTFIEDSGTSLKAALDVARRFGTVSDRDLPFRTGRLYRRDAKTFYALASQRKIAAYVNLDDDLDAWRRWIATEGPILTRLNVDPTFRNARGSGGRLDQYDASRAGGGHAVALVGYDRDGFTVRNSWGTDWGDRGFACAADGYAAAAFTEAYGVRL